MDPDNEVVQGCNSICELVLYIYLHTFAEDNHGGWNYIRQIIFLKDV